MKKKAKKHTPKKPTMPQKIEKKILGVTANLKNLMIAIVMLFAFLGGFFKVYDWAHDTFAERNWVRKIELEGKLDRENTVLNSLYARFCFLDQIITVAPDPTKVEPEMRKEWLELKSGKIERQKDKVKLLENELAICGRQP